MPPQCIIRIGNEKTCLPHKEISALKREAHTQAQQLGLRTDTQWIASNDNNHYRREYYDTANNPVIATISYT